MSTSPESRERSAFRAASLSSLPMGVLRLGTKYRRLRDAGIKVIGDLNDIWPITYPNDYGLGRSTIGKLEGGLKALVEAVGDNGVVNWNNYAAAIGCKIVPAAPSFHNGKDFLQGLPVVLKEISAALDDPVLRSILTERLAAGPSEQRTLQSIAEISIPPVTRERIRQKEKKLLEQIANGLIWDEYGSLPVIFRPEFSIWWKRAADHFEDIDELGFDEFMTGLAAVWNAEPQDIAGQLPLLVAIVTGEVQLRSEFRSSSRLDTRWLGTLTQKTRQLPLKHLRLGKTAAQLEAGGYPCVNDIIQGCVSGDLFSETPRAGPRAIDHLNDVCTCLTENGEFSWETYRNLRSLDTLPSTSCTSAFSFAQNLTDNLCEITNRLQTPPRAAEIFQLRTSLPTETRLTLDATAALLMTHGPSVKREESITLQKLNDVIVGRDFSRTTFWLSDEFLKYWQEAETAFLHAEQDYVVFTGLIADRWNLSTGLLTTCAPSLWAVLNGYPNGRPALKRREHRPSQSVPHTAEQASGRIRLRGFRRIH